MPNNESGNGNGNNNIEPIVVNSIFNGASNLSKIQHIYINIKAECGLMGKKPFIDQIYVPTKINTEPALYGSTMFRLADGTMMTFKFYKLSDPAEEKMNEHNRNNPARKYLSVSKMEITIKPQSSELEEKINKVIDAYNSQVKI